MSLAQYRKKRNFKKTSEPEGTIADTQSRLFVIQKHAASHLHYDFRLELHGVLKSWAVPKGPCLDPAVKRLAIEVEDHPIAYGSFEGTIPKGQYGAGTVMLWDKGTWEALDKNPYKAWKEGHLRFNVQAEKVKGRWDLIRFKEKQWFLIKYQDEYARKQDEYDLTVSLPNSVNSKIPFRKTVKKPDIKFPKGLKKTSFPDFIAPQLATLVDKPPEGRDWLHEIKWDGYRILAFKNGSEVILKSRNNKDWTDSFQSIADAIGQLPFEQIILDGEVVVLDKEGRSNFQLLQNALKQENNSPIQVFFFDLLYVEGRDVRKLPLIERKSLLQKILSLDIAGLHYSDHIEEEGDALYRYSCDKGLEGIISKQKDAPYHSGRGQDWLKIKCVKEQEFVIGGYTDPQKTRSGFGSLFLGVYNDKGTLDYAGNVGTGFNAMTLKNLHKQLLKQAIKKNPFNSNPPGYTKAHWVRPVLVCQIAFTEWTEEGHLRHPGFKGLRLDKNALDVVRERETPMKNIQKQSSKTAFKLTHPEKILYPEDKITKQDILDYYEAVSDYMLPYIINRPLTLLRCPSGYEQCFYQRHSNKTTPKTLLSWEDPLDEKHRQYIYLKDKEGLLSLVQMGVLEIHPWGSTIQQPEQPDLIIIDLDPAPEVPWSKVVAAATEIRDYLAEYKLVSFVKSTGGKGLHVVIPIQPDYDWVTIKEFTQVFVQCMEQIKPADYVSKMTKSKRMGKIFIDYLRNQRTATAVSAYSTRARIHAPVSTPLSWDELSDDRRENTYTIKTLPARLSQLKVDPWKDFFRIKQSLRLDDFS